MLNTIQINIDRQEKATASLAHVEATENAHAEDLETLHALENQLGKPVRLVDGERLSWYGSRAIAGLAYLRELSAAR
jgi:hypothetical protein